MLITMFIIMVLVANLFWMLVWGKTIWQTTLTRTGNHQELRLTLRKVENELRDSNVDTVTNNTSLAPSALSFLSAFDANGKFVTDAAGNPVWQKYVIVYIPSGTKKLLYKEIYGSFTNKLSPAELTAYCDGKGRFLSPSVARLNLTTDTGNNSANLSVTINAVNRLGKNDEQTLSTTVFLRN